MQQRQLKMVVALLLSSCIPLFRKRALAQLKKQAIKDYKKRRNKAKKIK
jgi:hypothetical protein